MGRFLFPNEYYTSTYAIDFNHIYRLGYRGLLFDIDNTLVPHDAMTDERSRALLEALRRKGFSICFVSNNHEPRVADFVKELHVEGLPDPQYVFLAHKPMAQGYIKGIQKMRLRRSKVLFIGDQLFTDIWGANNAKLPSILVQPVAKETKFKIKLKRILEKPVIWLYLKKHALKG
ncbi:MAG: HAD-IIIA family hydrolase [Eubacterium sp.]|nr:HAD-IIIA family hydrolase [Eubacterium sp.]